MQTSIRQVGAAGTANNTPGLQPAAMSGEARATCADNRSMAIIRHVSKPIVILLTGY